MDWLYLAAISLISATIQSATGFGFGLIAVPVFLLVLDSAQAIQMVMIIILVMSLIDWWKLKGQSSRYILKWLNVGLVIGFPFGLIIFHTVELPVLKSIVAVVIMLFSLFNLFRLLQGRQKKEKPAAVEPPKWTVVTTGYLSGLMSTSLAMPGPAVMLLLIHNNLDKTLIRATILTFFIFAYGGSILLQSLLIGVSVQTWGVSLALAPFGVAGVFAGHYIADKINQKLFKILVLIILVMTASVMLYQL